MLLSLDSLKEINVNFRRARTDEQIEKRQLEILGVCESLYRDRGYEGVNFKAISEMTSITRPSIYNYYETKDDILLDLLLKEMKVWENDILSLMDNNESLDKASYCSKMVDLLSSRELMLKLYSILFTVIERNCSTEKLVSFKRDIGKVFDTLSESVNRYFSSASPENRGIFTRAFFAYLLGLYSLADLSPVTLKANEIVGREPVITDFNDMFYRGMMLLMSDL